MEAEREYRQFTKPAELHKAINTLRGLVAGINSDRTVGTDEVTELVHWCEIHAELRDRHPFSEILPVVERACEDGVVTEDESKDILWLCSNFVDDCAYYDMVTSSVQFLAGMLHGLLADGELSDKEISSLKTWMDANEFLAGTYPFDEINSLLYVILEDKVITQREREALMALCSVLEASAKLTNRIYAFADSHADRRLMRMAEDNVIDPTERPEFDAILDELQEIVEAALTLRCARAAEGV